MKKAEADIRPEYRREELGQGVRGKYYDEYQKGTNLVLLSPDIAAIFPTDQAVNDALRSLIQVAQRATGLAPELPRQRRKKAVQS